jgi:hypothetical protein
MAKRAKKSSGERLGCGSGKHGVKLCVSNTPIPGFKCGRRMVANCRIVPGSEKGNTYRKVCHKAPATKGPKYACARSKG